MKERVRVSYGPPFSQLLVLSLNIYSQIERTIKTMKKKYGWKPQKKDARDLKIEHLAAIKKIPLGAPLPVVANNRFYCSQVKNQGDLGSCTANAWTSLLEYDECQNGRGGKLFNFMSRLFVYYNERVIENTVSQDSGAELRDGAKAIANQGVCIETEWPYIISQFTVQPTAQCYTDAKANIIHSYYSLDGSSSAETLQNLKTCLAAGQCFVFGFQVYSSFESDEVTNTGVMPMPDTTTEQLLGGHAVMAIGYNDAQQRFLVKNSWGMDWGLPNPKYRGYFTMLYDFISNPNMASDFWTVVKDV